MLFMHDLSDLHLFVCFLRATTHADLLLRAKERGVATKVIHNASIMNAVGCCGLQVCPQSSRPLLPTFVLCLLAANFWLKICEHSSRI